MNKTTMSVAEARARFFNGDLSVVPEMADEIERLQHILGRFVLELPLNRDWLDPQLEEMAKAAIGYNGAGKPLLLSPTITHCLVCKEPMLETGYLLQVCPSCTMEDVNDKE